MVFESLVSWIDASDESWKLVHITFPFTSIFLEQAMYLGDAIVDVYSRAHVSTSNQTVDFVFGDFILQHGTSRDAYKYVSRARSQICHSFRSAPGYLDSLLKVNRRKKIFKRNQKKNEIIIFQKN
jgi:hypothetical protein